MAKKETTTNSAFVDPFEIGVTYAAFLESLGEKTVSEYLSSTHTKEQIEWIESEINNFKNK